MYDRRLVDYLKIHPLTKKYAYSWTLLCYNSDHEIRNIFRLNCFKFSPSSRIFSILIALKGSFAKYQLFSTLIIMDHAGCIESPERKEEKINVDGNKQSSSISKFTALLYSPSTTVPKELPSRTVTPIRSSTRSRFMLTSLSSHSIVARNESLVYF